MDDEPEDLAEPAVDLRTVAEEAQAEAPLGAEVEGRLLALSAAGDAGARERLFRAYARRATGLAEARTGAGLDVAELMQEASLALIEAIASSETAGSLAGRVDEVVSRHLDEAIQAEKTAEREQAQLVDDAEAYTRAQIETQRRLGRAATEAELAEKLEWSLPRTRRLGELVEEARRRHDAELLRYVDPQDLSEWPDAHQGGGESGRG